MPIEFNRLAPFFQVTIYRCADDFDLSRVRRNIKRAINAQAQSGFNRFATAKGSWFEGDNLTFGVVIHSSLPSWYKVSPGTVTEAFGVVTDKENDLFVVHYVAPYLFTSTSCQKLFDRIHDAVLKDETVSAIDPNSILKIRNSVNPRFKSLGIQNVFGSGGTAPESKAYFARRAQNCLTKSFDNGFGFGYGIGTAEIDGKDNPFGCSTSKSKVWRTWVENLNEFEDHCNHLVGILEGPELTSAIPLLVEPVDIDPSTLEPLAFYLDYWIEERGAVYLVINGKAYHDWFVTLCPENNRKLQLELIDQDDENNLIILEFDLAYNEERECWTVKGNEAENVSVKIAESPQNLNTKPSCSFAEWLGKSGEKAYTVVFEGGFAQRCGAIYGNSLLRNPFDSIIGDLIDWTPVNITQESKIVIGETNILQQLMAYFDGSTNAVDDGANEVADLIAIQDGSFILVHSKASGKSKPGLRVDDVQVVAAQALKSLRFFSFDNYSVAQLRRLFGKLVNGPDTLEDFADLMRATLSNPRIMKECWIVQPGIAADQLIKNPINKIHTILNFVDSAMSINDIRFSLVCSPE